MEMHIDEGYIINAVLYFGKVKSGGSTLQFESNEISETITKKHDIPFQHGRVTIGFTQQNKLLCLII